MQGLDLGTGEEEFKVLGTCRGKFVCSSRAEVRCKDGKGSRLTDINRNFVSSCNSSCHVRVGGEGGYTQHLVVMRIVNHVEQSIVKRTPDLDLISGRLGERLT